MNSRSAVEIAEEKPRHYPVLQSQIQKYLPSGIEEGVVIDATVGLGGHSKILLQAFPHAQLIAIDTDPEMLCLARKSLASWAERVSFWHGWFDAFFSKESQNYSNIQAILFDFGVNRLHYQESGRGFSLHLDEKLDMRLNPHSQQTAENLINTLSEEELATLFWRYSEERFSRRVARLIIEKRQQKSIVTSAELREIIYRAVPRQSHYRLRKHVASRCFQALRIAVNNELDRLEKVLPLAFEALAPGGVLACVSFHSLEDRLVKKFFRSQVQLEHASLLHKKPLVPDAVELAENRASRSAKLRLLCKKTRSRKTYAMV